MVFVGWVVGGMGWDGRGGEIGGMRGGFYGDGFYKRRIITLSEMRIVMVEKI